MRELILSDIHQKYKQADQIIKKEKPDRIFTLGDWFDDFYDNPLQTGDMCRWALDNLGDDNCLGNHDQHYFSPNLHYRCSGYTQAKAEVIQKYFPPDVIRKKFKLYHHTSGFLLTHAGITKPLVEHFDDLSLSFLRTLMDATWEKIFDPINSYALIGVGHDRGGFNAWGGMTWCDWNYFYPIKGIPQIVGHTPGSKVRYAHSDYMRGSEKNSRKGNWVKELLLTADMDVSLCLDTHLNHYAVIEDGVLSVKNA